MATAKKLPPFKVDIQLFGGIDLMLSFDTMEDAQAKVDSIFDSGFVHEYVDSLDCDRYHPLSSVRYIDVFKKED
jgi:hypothetical protein